MSPLAALGIGCRAHVEAPAILRVVEQALAQAPAGTRLSAIHTSERKADAEGLREAAETLGLPLCFHAEEALGKVESRLLNPSERVKSLTGVAGIAEAAALVGAGEGAELIVPKFSAEGVSCALAMVPERTP